MSNPAPFKTAGDVVALLWGISAFMAFVTLALFAIAVCGYWSHPDDHDNLMCIVKGGIGLAALTVLQVWYHRCAKPLLRSLGK